MVVKKRAAAPSMVQQSKQLAAAHKKQKLTQQYQRDKEQLETQRKQAKKQSAARSPYKPHHTLLLIGEGNFSFARSLISAPSAPGFTPLPGRNITATCFDSFAVARDKYVDVQENVDALRAAGVRVWDCIDATQLHNDSTHFPSQSDAASLLSPPPLPHYDFIIFNFPHTGCGITDTQANIQLHQQLLVAFLQSLALAPHLLSPTTRIHITVKAREPYNSWHLPLLPRYLPPLDPPAAANTTTTTAATAVAGPVRRAIRFVTSMPFWPHLYPLYSHRRTIGYKVGLSAEGNEEIEGGAMTYVYMRTAEAETVKGGGSAKAADREEVEEVRLLPAIEQPAVASAVAEDELAPSAASEDADGDDDDADERTAQHTASAPAVQAAVHLHAVVRPTPTARTKVKISKPKRTVQSSGSSKLNLRGLLFT